MSSQVQPIGSFPSAYRLVTPAVTVDASAGIVEVDNNAKFNTNIPLDRYMFITQVDWYVTMTKAAIFGAGPLGVSWHVEFQLSEALSRTVVTFSDPVYVDEGLFEYEIVNKEATAVGEEIAPFKLQFPFRHVLANPWATAAQQLNLLAREVPFATVGLSSAWKHSVSAVIEYQLLPLSPDIRAYLATRIQIAGQA